MLGFCQQNKNEMKRLWFFIGKIFCLARFSLRENLIIYEILFLTSNGVDKIYIFFYLGRQNERGLHLQFDLFLLV